MAKRLFIVHGWAEEFQDGWFPWLQHELEPQGFVVSIPHLPDVMHPKIDIWVPALAAEVGEVDEQTFFVGHSAGCQTIIRYIESLPADIRVGGAVFVAPWFTKLNGLESAEEEAIAAPWITMPIDFQKVQKQMPKSYGIFSDNDPYVSLVNEEILRTELAAKTEIQHGMLHFAGDEGITEIPAVRDAILAMSQ